MWIDISKPHYGIHGTPEPGTVGHTSSHGCVRLTNWDALKLAAMVGKGTKVEFVVNEEATHAAAARRASWIVFAAAIGFLGGMMVMAALVTMFPSGAAIVAEPLIQARRGRSKSSRRRRRSRAPVTPPPPASRRPPALGRQRRSRTCGIAQLTLPVQGIKRDDLRDTFNEMRGSSRRHEALDVLAPRNTPVLAVEDGTIARLFLSDAGGITIYQFDPTDDLLLLLRASRALRGWA